MIAANGADIVTKLAPYVVGTEWWIVSRIGSGGLASPRVGQLLWHGSSAATLPIKAIYVVRNLQTFKGILPLPAGLISGLG
jgi:hypothetical protein